VPELGLGQPMLQRAILFPVPLLIDQQREPLLEAQLTDPVPLSGTVLRAEGLGHAGQAQGVQLLQGLLIQHESSSPSSTGPSAYPRDRNRPRPAGSNARSAVEASAPPGADGRAHAPESTSRCDRNRLPSRRLAPRQPPAARSNSLGRGEECPNRTDSPSPGAAYFPEWRRTTGPWPVLPAEMPGDMLAWANGSTLHGVPGCADQIRQYHPTVCVFDEAAYLDEFEQAYGAAEPVAAQIIAVSSAGPSVFGDICQGAFDR
jgi:hypothetical protein